MAKSVRAAGIVMGGVGGLSPKDVERAAGETIVAYARAGIHAFLFPGALAAEPELLASLVLASRKAAFDAGSGAALVAIGGTSEPGFGLPPFPDSPSPLSLASSGSVAAARRCGALLGSRLASCGIDMVMGPSLDLASDPKDPAGALDGFGEDSRIAGSLGAAFVRGLARAGVLACVGRFPGLGSTCRDSREGMALIDLPAPRLERCEIRPFARAIEAKVPAILVGRVLVPSLESEHIPASASARVIEGRLRDSLGFRGAVIGDDIGPGEEPGKAAVLGALAGCDLCLFSEAPAALAAASALDAAQSGGELPYVRIESARRRVERLMERGAKREASVPTRPASGSVPQPRLRKASRDIQDGVCLLRGTLELDGARRDDFSDALGIVFLPPEGSQDARESGKVLAAMREGLPGIEVVALPADPGGGEADSLARMLSDRGRYAEAVILSYDAHFRPSQESIARLVGEYLPNFRVIAMRDPYDAAFFPYAVGLGAAFGFSEGCARAVALLLSGKIKARGRCPVEVIGLEI